MFTSQLFYKKDIPWDGDANKHVLYYMWHHKFRLLPADTRRCFNVVFKPKKGRDIDKVISTSVCFYNRYLTLINNVVFTLNHVVFTLSLPMWHCRCIIVSMWFYKRWIIVTQSTLFPRWIKIDLVTSTLFRRHKSDNMHF